MSAHPVGTPGFRNLKPAPFYASNHPTIGTISTACSSLVGSVGQGSKASGPRESAVVIEDAAIRNKSIVSKQLPVTGPTRVAKRNTLVWRGD